MQAVDNNFMEVARQAMVIAYIVCNARCIPSQSEMDRFNELDAKWKGCLSINPIPDTLPNRCREEGI